MKPTNNRSSTALAKTARKAGEKIREVKARVAPKLKKAARVAGANIRRAEAAIAERVQHSVERARASLSNEQKAFVIGRTADRDVRGRAGKVLAPRGQRITNSMADEAQRRGLLDELYRAAGGSMFREFGHATKNLVTATGERLRAGATRVKATATEFWHDVSGEDQSGATPLPPTRTKTPRRGATMSRKQRRGRL